jgi:predicted secreted hydrolase
MDHEWFTHQLEPGQVGWDWFSIQLDDRTDLMLFQLRREDGTVEPYSSGTHIDSQGRPRHLSRQDFSLRPGRWNIGPVRKQGGATPCAGGFSCRGWESTSNAQLC